MSQSFSVPLHCFTAFTLLPFTLHLSKRALILFTGLVGRRRPADRHTENPGAGWQPGAVCAEWSLGGRRGRTLRASRLTSNAWR
jgi:hypothetical protein